MVDRLGVVGKIKCNSLAKRLFTPNIFLTVHCCLHQWYEIQCVWMCFFMHALTGDDVLHNDDM